MLDLPPKSPRAKSILGQSVGNGVLHGCPLIDFPLSAFCAKGEIEKTARLFFLSASADPRYRSCCVVKSHASSRFSVENGGLASFFASVVKSACMCAQVKTSAHKGMNK